MLILLNDQYVNPNHIIQVVMHPSGRDVCVILTNGQEIRIERGFGGKDEAVARVARNIMSKAGAQ